MKKVAHQQTGRLGGIFFQIFIKAALTVPYNLRIPAAGWIVSMIISPIAGYSRKSRENIRRIWPEISERSVRRIARRSSNNFGKTLIEIFSAQEFQKKISDTKLEGPGVQQLIDDAKNNRPVILVSAHFGNFDVVRSVISEQIKPVGALYRPLNDRRFNKYWEVALEGISKPIFPRDRKGLANMIMYLKGGNIIALLADQRVHTGELLRFFERPALTTLSPAQLANKYDASLFPVFSVREGNGTNHRVFICKPVQKEDPIVMMQKFNDLLQAFVIENPDLWFWAHNRWKI